MNLSDIFSYDILEYIKDFLPLENIVCLNRTNYMNHHHVLYKHIYNYEKYVRYMIRKDYDYVVERILNENFNRWYSMKKYFYKHMIFYTYLNFLIEYANEHESMKSKNIIENMLRSNLGEKRHKKTRVIFNRWKIACTQNKSPGTWNIR